MKNDKKLILFDWGNVLLDGNTGEYTIFDARRNIADELQPGNKEIFAEIFNDNDFWTLSGIDLYYCIHKYLGLSDCRHSVDEFKECYYKYYQKVTWYSRMKTLIETLIIDGRFHLGILSTLCEMDYELLKINLPIDKFDYRFFSFNLGVQKPNERIYRNVEIISGIKPCDILSRKQGVEYVISHRQRFRKNMHKNFFVYRNKS